MTSDRHEEKRTVFCSREKLLCHKEPGERFERKASLSIMAENGNNQKARIEFGMEEMNIRPTQ